MLSACGFFSLDTRVKGEVQCYSCDVILQSDDLSHSPWEIHRSRRGDCEHARMGYIAVSEQERRLGLTDKGLSGAVDTYTRNGATVTLAGETVCYECTVRLNTNNPLKDHKQKSPHCPIVATYTRRQNDTMSDNGIGGFLARLDTFNDWCRECDIEGNTLAASGFYHSGEDSVVICTRCSFPCKNFTTAAHLYFQHKLMSPSCQLLTEDSQPETRQPNITTDIATLSDQLELEVEKDELDLQQQRMEAFNSRARKTQRKPQALQKTMLVDITCNICATNIKDITLIPCGHCLCTSCQSRLEDTKCPTCRRIITKTQVLRL